MSERREYDLQTDVLAAIVATTPVTLKHAELLAALATRSEFQRARYVMTRETFGEVPARVIDTAGREIAADYSAWIETQLAAHGGSARAVWQVHRDCGYLLTEISPRLHYFAHDRGGAQENFVQIEVWEEHEFVRRELFPRDDLWGLPDASELRRGWPGMAWVERVSRRSLGESSYRLKAAIDMRRLAALGEELCADRQLVETTTSAVGIASRRGLTSGYDRPVWPGRRFFDDWTTSSAGRAGQRVCTRWMFALLDRTSTDGARYLSILPQSAHTRAVMALEDPYRLNADELYRHLINFDNRVGMPFAWYFHGLHGDLVQGGYLTRVLEAVEARLIALPEHDHEVLRRWGADPYAF